MACMEHLCVGCGELVFTNTAKPEKPCPKCGSTRWASQHDEQLEIKREEGDNDDTQEDLDGE